MLRRLNLLVMIAICVSATRSWCAPSDSFGLKSTTIETAPEQRAAITGLPYSTQWTHEQIESYLYIAYNSAYLHDSTDVIDQHYVVTYDKPSIAYPSINYFSRILTFAPIESSSFGRYFGLWARYSLGFAAVQGQLSDTVTQINSGIETSSLFIAMARLGLNVTFDKWRWIRPFIGADIDPYAYRQTADLSGAERQGFQAMAAISGGAHLPVFFDGRGSLFGEVRSSRVVTASTAQVFKNSTELSAGLGVTF